MIKMMIKTLFHIGLVFLSFPATAQPRIVYQKTFSGAEVGGRNNVLNLSSSATVRTPFLDEVNLQTPLKDFSMVLWVKGLSDEETYTFLDWSVDGGEKDTSHAVWTLGKQATGAWYWQGCRGEKKYEYKPTAQKQSISQGWTLLGLSYQAEKKELRFYYNGKNRAIYYVPDLLPATIKQFQLSLGGKTAGEVQEWESFNGYLADARIYDGVLSAEKMAALYEEICPGPQKKERVDASNQLKVMSYNIWHGGKETGKLVGPQRVAEIIKQEGADIIAMQETYGSGALIADRLGYYFYLRSDNLSIMSRFPIKETLDTYHPFYSAAAVIDMDGQAVIVASNWLNYPFDYWAVLEKGQAIDTAEWRKKQEGNAQTLEKILSRLKVAIETTDKVPVIFCGDFNSGSHLDWTAEAKTYHQNYVMPFPSTALMETWGFRDSYRVVHPDPIQQPGITWSPFIKSAFPDRIDYIFYKGLHLRALDAVTVQEHPVSYPSDHAAVLTTFEIKN